MTRKEVVQEPHNFYVKLPGDVSDALYRVAARQWRHPREQALYFIAEVPDREPATAASGPDSSE
jgi:hypothetical protein